MSERRLWRVDVEEQRRTTFYVQAASEEAAREDAAILADQVEPTEWDDIDSGWVMSPVQKHHQVHGPVWTGGLLGEWIDGDEMESA